MTSGAQFKGLSDLKRVMSTLPEKVERNLMRSGMRAGAKVIQGLARDNVPVERGVLRDSLRIGTRAAGGVVIASIKAGGKGKWGDAFYAGWVEFGTDAHHIEARPGSFLTFNGHSYLYVDHPGAAPHPFMRPALDAGAMAAVQAVADKLRTALATKHGLDVPAPIEEGDE